MFLVCFSGHFWFPLGSSLFGCMLWGILGGIRLLLWLWCLGRVGFLPSFLVRFSGWFFASVSEIHLILVFLLKD